MALPAVSAQDYRFSVDLIPGDRLTITTRANLRQYQDGRFVGLSHRENRSLLQVVADPQLGTFLQGTVYVLEETRRDTLLVAQRVDRVVPTVFAILPDGTIAAPDRVTYPTLRGVPGYPPHLVSPGETWEAAGMYLFDPFGDGTFTRIPILSLVEFTGEQQYHGRSYLGLSAQFAVRYRGGDPTADQRISGASGSHRISILFDPEANRPYFLQDNVQETYTLRDGGTVGFEGFSLTWLDSARHLDRTQIAQEVEDQLRNVGVADVEVSESEAGVILTINQIRFVADQAVVLPEERPRLAALATALAAIAERTFLVIGHTADVGNPGGQMQRSVQRAKAVVDAMVAAGIPGRRFLYEGRGATEPLAANDTDAGRGRNRRVEIIILED